MVSASEFNTLSNLTPSLFCVRICASFLFFYYTLYLYICKRMVRVTYMPAAKSVLLYLTIFDATNVLFRMSIISQEGFWCAWQASIIQFFGVGGDFWEAFLAVGG